MRSDSSVLKYVVGTIVIIGIICLILDVCRDYSTTYQVEDTSESDSLVQSDITTQFMQISKYLWYDRVTLIVYMWNGDFDTMPSPYYAPTGIPYKYDVEFGVLKLDYIH